MRLITTEANSYLKRNQNILAAVDDDNKTVTDTKYSGNLKNMVTQEDALD